MDKFLHICSCRGENIHSEHVPRESLRICSHAVHHLFPDGVGASVQNSNWCLLLQCDLPKFLKPVQDIFRNRFCSHTKCCVSLSLLLFSLLQASDVPLGHKTQRVYSH